jgi:Tfp pilus assembly protein PilF
MSLLGYLNLVNGSLDEAKVWFDRAIAEDPSYAQSHIGYGDLYAAEQNYREAKESYAKAAELEPRSFHAWFNGGLCALRLGEVETADRYLIRAAEVDPAALLRNPNLPPLQSDPRLVGFRAALSRAMQPQ